MDGYALRDDAITPALVGGAAIKRATTPKGGPSAPLFTKAPNVRRGRLAAAAAASLLLHGCLLLGFIRYVHTGPRGDATDVEAPIELVLEAPAPAQPDVSAAPAAEQQAPPILSTPAAVAAPAPEPPAIAAAVQPEISQQPAPVASAPAPDTSEILEKRRREQEAERAARERRRALELARARAEERAEERAEQRAVDRERRQEAARRAAERAKATEERRRAAAQAEAAREARAALEVSREGGGATARQQVAHRPSAPARAAATDESNRFDAASYRAIVARAVRAAVGSRCSIGAGSRVVIALVIGRSGAISSASVSSPSGNSAFDAASIAAVRGAGPFPPPTGRSSVSVPVGVACR